MKRDPWMELLQAVRESGEVAVRERPPRTGRPRAPFDADGLVALRRRFGLSQTRFARMLGISVATLRGWEQRRRTPEGPARMLLEVCALHPREVLSAAAAVLRRGGLGPGIGDGHAPPAAHPPHRGLDSPASTRRRARRPRAAGRAPA
jgi:putative transcriptional regulator